MRTPDSPRPLRWTPELVDRFWSYQASRPHDYFTYHHGAAIAFRFAREVKRHLRVLDFGCGLGFLAKRLLDLNYHVTCTDNSPPALSSTNERLEGNPRFGGAHHVDELLRQRAEFDAVTAVEVIEHLDDADLAEFMSSMRRLLTPGGVLYMTTPNNENLQLEEVFCPASNYYFHRWQHVRSWSKQSLSDYLRSEGYRITRTVETDFSIRPREHPILQAKILIKQLTGATSGLPHLVVAAEAPQSDE